VNADSEYAIFIFIKYTGGAKRRASTRHQLQRVIGRIIEASGRLSTIDIGEIRFAAAKFVTIFTREFPFKSPMAGTF
jgi:hypothetical protein